VFAAQFTSRLVLLLLIAAILSVFLGERIEAAVILAIIAINALLGFVQEYRAERALVALRTLITHWARVRRDGANRQIPATELVPGDLVLLEIGDRVPADLELVRTDELTLDESIITGESLPVEKSAGGGTAFMSTIVSAGSGEGVVTATGRATVVGRTATVLEHAPPETDFRKSIGHSARCCSGSRC
jgi:Ca2+-transporting ATPase